MYVRADWFMRQCYAAELKYNYGSYFLQHLKSQFPQLFPFSLFGRQRPNTAIIMDVSPLASPQVKPSDGVRRNSFHDRTLPAIPLLSTASTATSTTLGMPWIEKHPSVPVWPKQPQSIKRGGWLSILAFMGDTIIALTSTAFIVFGSLVLHFDGVPTSEVSPLSVLNQLSILSNASRIVSLSMLAAHVAEYRTPSR
jgi:hypothetical protein